MSPLNVKADIVPNRMQRLARWSMDLGMVQRATDHPDGTTPESVTTHSHMLAMIAFDLIQVDRNFAGADVLPERMDPGLVLKFALIHDLPEAHAGDTNTVQGLTEGQAAAKEDRENEARARIEQDLPGWVSEAIEQYEAQVVPEARFVRYLDKILPKLTHELNGGSSLRRQGLTLADLQDAHRRQAAKLHERYPEFAGVEDLFIASCMESEEAYERALEAEPLKQPDPTSDTAPGLESALDAPPPGLAISVKQLLGGSLFGQLQALGALTHPASPYRLDQPVRAHRNYAAPAYPSPRWFKHEKRGSYYEKVGLANVQAGDPVRQGAVVTVYRSCDGDLWVRPRDEFDDGRFTAVPDDTISPLPTKPGLWTMYLEEGCCWDEPQRVVVDSERSVPSWLNPNGSTQVCLDGLYRFVGEPSA